MASAGGMVLASFALPSSLRKIIDGAAPAARSSARLTSAPISEIQHVVVLMQENRSFDHYFGTMPGVRGFADTSVPKSRFYQYDSDNPDKYLLPFHTDTHSTSAQNLPSNSHSWGPQHDSWDNGKMDGFVTAHLAADGLLQAGRHPVPLGSRRCLHDLRRVPLLDARPDLAQPAIPDDRPGRPGGPGRRPGLRELRAAPGLLVADLPGDAHLGRGELEGLPGGR